MPDAHPLSRPEIRPFHAPCGAEVNGLDLSRPLSDEAFARIHRAHLDHHVLVFRDLAVTPEQQIAFSRRFGPLQVHVLHQFQLPGYPEILVVSNIKENGKPVAAQASQLAKGLWSLPRSSRSRAAASGPS